MDKYALVTASTKGIGKAIGLELLGEGYYVFFNYAHNDENANKLEEELSRYSGKYSIIKADLSYYEGISVLINSIIAITKNVDVIVLNAGATCKVPFNEISLEQWERVVNTNVNVPFFTIQKMDHLIRDRGRIIFISSHLGLIPHATSIPYSVSKAAVIMLAKSLVKVYKRRLITVNVIAPGFVDTEWHQSKAPEHRKRVENKIALGRFAEPKEIASACVYIIGNDYLNGAVLQIDGGYDME